MGNANGSILLLPLDGADTYTLRKTLFDEYGPSDRRIKKIEKAIHFRVDQSQIHTGADGNPLSHVCVMFAQVNDDGSLKVSLTGNVPSEAPVQRWIESMGVAPSRPNAGLSFVLRKGEQHKLSSLAQAR